jgi:hypothetical protein
VGRMAKPVTMTFAEGMVEEGVCGTIVTCRICLAKWEEQARPRFVPLLNRKDERDEPRTLELQLEKSKLMSIVPSAADKSHKLVTAERVRNCRDVGVSWFTRRSHRHQISLKNP